MGDGCRLSSFSIHAALRYMDMIFLAKCFKSKRFIRCSSAGGFRQENGFRVEDFDRNHLLLGLVCLLLGAKFNEPDENLPKYHHLLPFIQKESLISWTQIV